MPRYAPGEIAAALQPPSSQVSTVSQAVPLPSVTQVATAHSAASVTVPVHIPQLSLGSEWAKAMPATVASGSTGGSTAGDCCCRR